MNSEILLVDNDGVPLGIFEKMFSKINTVNLEKTKKYASVIGFFEKPISFDKIHRMFELIKQN